MMQRSLFDFSAKIAFCFFLCTARRMKFKCEQIQFVSSRLSSTLNRQNHPMIWRLLVDSVC
jgi:hypothetical protein